MLDDEQAMPRLDQAVKGTEQHLNVTKVKPRRRLIQDEELPFLAGRFRGGSGLEALGSGVMRAAELLQRVKPLGNGTRGVCGARQFRRGKGGRGCALRPLLLAIGI